MVSLFLLFGPGQCKIFYFVQNPKLFLIVPNTPSEKSQSPSGKKFWSYNQYWFTPSIQPPSAQDLFYCSSVPQACPSRPKSPGLSLKITQNQIFSICFTDKELVFVAVVPSQNCWCESVASGL